MIEQTPSPSMMLSNQQPSVSELRLAVTVVLVSVVLFLTMAPFAKTPLAKVWAFIPAYESALFINDMITAALLAGQFAIVRSRAIWILMCGYLFTAGMTIPHALSFPGLFSANGLLGAGPQTTAWLYMFWHAGFPLFVIAYAILKADNRPLGMRNAFAILLLVPLAVVGATLLTTQMQDVLPPVMLGNHYTPEMRTVVASVWALSFVAALVLWLKKPHSVLDIWLLVVMCAWIFDIALSAVLNAGRFDLGFYTGRIYGLAAASFVFIVLSVENNRLYMRLAQMHRDERRRARELAASNQDLESFSYSVSHDLRAPLRAIDGFSGMLARRATPRLDAEDQRMLGVIRDNAKMMGRLIDDLLIFSRLGRQAMAHRPIDMQLLVREAWLPMAEQFQGEFILHELPPCEGDRALLKQVWVNLLSNAVKYSGGREKARIEVSGCRLERACSYAVCDNGVGFDMRYIDKLFGVFQRLHSAEEFPGSGIGLAIVARVVGRHDGQVQAEGEKGVGATFRFTLPAGLERKEMSPLSQAEPLAAVEASPGSVISSPASHVECNTGPLN